MPIHWVPHPIGSGKEGKEWRSTVEDGDLIELVDAEVLAEEGLEAAPEGEEAELVLDGSEPAAEDHGGRAWGGGRDPRGWGLGGGG